MPKVDAKIWLNKDRIRLQPHSSVVENKLHQIPGYWHSQGETWSWPATPFVAGTMVQVLQGHQVDYDQGWFDLFKQWQAEQHANGLKERVDLPEHPSKTRSWMHQRQAFQYLLRLSAGGLFADMGTGKTKVVIDLIVNRGHRTTLVVCPKKAIQGWVREADTHAALPLNVIKLDGTLDERVAKLTMPHHAPVVFVTNFDALQYSKMQAALSRWKWDLVVLDEAHKIKAPQGKTSKFLYQLGAKARYRLALTGTPAADKPLDVYGVYRFLDPGVFGLSFTNFKNRYAVIQRQQTRTGQIYDEILGYQNQEEMNEKMYSIAFRVTDDILDLPRRHHIPVPVVLDYNNQKLYDELEKEGVLTLGEADYITKNKITLLMRLQQITSGFISDNTDEDARVTTPLGTEKADALRELLDEFASDAPVVVFYRFTFDCDRIRQAAQQAGRSCLEVSGRRDDLETWRNSDGGEVLAVQIAAGGAGVELQRSNKVVYYSKDFSLTNYDQSVKRIHRPGQKHECTYWHLDVVNSIDEYIFDALAHKKDVTQHVVDRLRRKAGLPSEL